MLNKKLPRDYVGQFHEVHIRRTTIPQYVIRRNMASYGKW